MTEPIGAGGSLTSQKGQRITGIVKFYSVQKCYGFIKRDDTKEYVFVHSKSVSGRNQRRVTRSLAKGEHVEFDVVLSDRSPEALNVTGPNLGPVLGSEYALISMQWHQYDDYKRELLQNGASREQSPRARRFYHRRQPRAHVQPNRGHRSRHSAPSNGPPIEANGGTANAGERRDTNRSSNGRRNRNRNRRPRQRHTASATESAAATVDDTANISTLLSELDLTNNLISANSTSSESLDFEKISSDETALAISCAPAPLSTTSRLAASFTKVKQ